MIKIDDLSGKIFLNQEKIWEIHPMYWHDMEEVYWIISDYNIIYDLFFEKFQENEFSWEKNDYLVFEKKLNEKINLILKEIFEKLNKNKTLIKNLEKENQDLKKELEKEKDKKNYIPFVWNNVNWQIKFLWYVKNWETYYEKVTVSFDNFLNKFI